MTNAAVPDNDPAIGDDTTLWRRIHPRQWVLDENIGGMRISSGAFDDPSDGTPMSAFIADECLGQDGVLQGYRERDGSGLAAFSAGAARGCHMGVIRFPLEGQPGHTHVVGKKTNSVRKCLRNAATILVEPIRDD